jgi:hypothetical protein
MNHCLLDTITTLILCTGMGTSLGMSTRPAGAHLGQLETWSDLFRLLDQSQFVIRGMVCCPCWGCAWMVHVGEFG